MFLKEFQIEKLNMNKESKGIAAGKDWGNKNL
jgi:hypothetical protein